MLTILDTWRNVFVLLQDQRDIHPLDKRICIAASLNVLMNVLMNNNYYSLRHLYSKPFSDSTSNS